MNTNKPTGQIKISPINIKVEQAKGSSDVGNCNYKINKLQIYYNRYKYNIILLTFHQIHLRLRH